MFITIHIIVTSNIIIIYILYTIKEIEISYHLKMSNSYVIMYLIYTNSVNLNIIFHQVQVVLSIIGYRVIIRKTIGLLIRLFIVNWNMNASIRLNRETL